MSIVDKDARHGAKSDKKKFTGYKVNSIMSEDGFIKNINATPGNSYDGDILIPLIDEMIKNGFNASDVVGDTAYGEVDNRNKLLLKGITVIAPFKKETNKGFFPQSKFTIEEHGVTCPAGCRTMVWNHNKKNETITFYFIGHRLRSYFLLLILFFGADLIISYSNHSSLNLFLFTCGSNA